MNLKLSQEELRHLVYALTIDPNGNSRLLARLKKVTEPKRMCSCGQAFFPVRRGQMFCSALCSRKQRQKEYWARRGKKVRRQRVARSG